MRSAVRMGMVLAVISLAGCPDEKPIDLSAAKKKPAVMPGPRPQPIAPRPTMPDGTLPFPLPVVTEAPTLAFARELVLFDHGILRKATTKTGTYAGDATPYTRPVSLAPVGVSARLDDGAGQIALFVNETSSAIDTLYLLDDLKLASVAFAVDVDRARRGQLPYLFGPADKAVRDRVQIDVTEDEIVVGEETIEGRAVAPLAKLLEARRAQSAVGLEARLGIRAGTTNQRLASVLEVLARAKVEALHLVPVQDSVAHSSTAYADSGGGIPSVRIGQPNVQGDLDKAIIRRYIKRNIQKLTYCYEKELIASPDLAGTVTTQFFIAPTGMVTTSHASGVSPRVAACVDGVIESIEFPRPKGGGGVQVNYPFTFRPDGG